MTREEFLKEYEALCRKCGFFINACGCCDSPWIETVGLQDAISIEEYIEHLRRS